MSALPDPAAGRALEERLALRAPRLARAAASRLLRLSPGSPLRRRAIKRLARLAFDASSRGDYAVVELLYDADVELRIHGDEWQSMGFAPSYRGYEGWLSFMQTWRTDMPFTRWETVKLIDLGDALVIRVAVTAKGATSDVETYQDAGYAYRLREGAVIRQDVYYTWAACCEALGIDPDAAA